MPLPAALLAKLSKRGIIKAQEPKKPEDVEEVFAEDYDEPEQPFSMLDSIGGQPMLPDESLSSTTAVNTTVAATAKTDNKIEGYEEIACPNKCNPYHQCTEYCLKRYGKVTLI
ncbi:hypothetical protein Ahia01_000124100, partial [Argonauta hians]